MTTPRPTRRIGGSLRWALVAVLSFGATEAAWRLQWAQDVEQLLSDQDHRWRGRVVNDVPVVLITIDDEALAANPDPFAFWGPQFARMIGNLREAGASVIGFDVLFTVGAEDWFVRQGFTDDPRSRTWDSGFRMKLATEPVVLAAHLATDDQGNPKLRLPLETFVAVLDDPAARIGLVNTLPDRDDVIRRFRPAYDSEPGALGLGFPLLLSILHTGGDPLASSWTLGGRTVSRSDPPLEVAYAGPPDAIPRLPFESARRESGLTPEEKALVKGKIAVVGARYTGTKDIFATPYARGSGWMHGPELHANAVVTLVGGRRVERVDGWARVLILAIWSVLSSVAWFRTSPGRGAALLVAASVAWVAGGYAIFAGADLIIPAASAIFVGALGYGLAYALRFERESRESKFVRSVFERYGSEAVVKQLLEEPGALQLGGARREMTVLFCDIRNFTTISEEIRPEQLVELLNEYFRRACRPILDEGGLVDKFIGDAVMAVFGVPKTQPDHARQGLRAALGMVRELEGFRAWLHEKYPDKDLHTRFDIGVGLHTGEAIAGNIGFERRTEYTVIGDTVNTASRIEGLTKSVGVRILASKETLVAAGPGVLVGRHAELPVKGRVQPVEVFEIVGFDSAI